MAARCVSPIKARVIRMIKLDACGLPVSGAGGAGSSVVVADGFVSVAATPEYEEGEEFIQKKASGAICVNDKDANELKRVGLEINLCVMDPDLLIVATGERLITTSPGPSGTGVIYGEGQLTARFSLELWQPVAGSGACDASGNQQFVYWAWPNVGNAQITDHTFENGVFNYGFQAETKAANTLWPNRIGTNNWVDFTANPLLAGDHWLHNVTTTAPPTATCGAVLL